MTTRHHDVRSGLYRKTALHKTALQNNLEVGMKIKNNTVPEKVFYVIRIEKDYAFIGPCRGSTIGETRVSFHRIFFDADFNRKRDWSVII